MRECEVIWLEKHRRWVNHSLFFNQLQFSLSTNALYIHDPDKMFYDIGISSYPSMIVLDKFIR